MANAGLEVLAETGLTAPNSELANPPDRPADLLSFETVFGEGIPMNNNLLKVFRRCSGAALLASAFALGGAGVAFADELCPTPDEPRVTVDPSIVYVQGDGPWTEDLKITIDLISAVSSYDTLEVKFDGALAYSGEKPQPSASKTICTNKTGGDGTCDETGSSVVEISYSAEFDEIREYTVEVNAEVSGPNDVCETAYVFVLEFLTVEYKAPPALANEYINDTPNYRDTASGGVRGCIISQIAHHHAKEEKYGPKGGDGVAYPGVGYNLDAIKMDVDDYYGECSVEEALSQGNGRGRGR